MKAFVMKAIGQVGFMEKPFPFGEMERAFEIMDKKLDGVLKPLIVF